MNSCVRYLLFLADTFSSSFNVFPHKVTLTWQIRQMFTSPAVKGQWWQRISPVISCHSSKPSAFLFLRDTRLRGRDPGILSELEGAFTVIQSTPFILQMRKHGPRALEWPALGSMHSSSWRRPASVWPYPPLAPGFPSQGQHTPGQVQLLCAHHLHPSRTLSFKGLQTQGSFPSFGTGPFYL